mgnify:FL=1
MRRWRELLLDKGPEESFHMHVGMRIVKTVIAVYLCGLIGYLRDELGFFAIIAAVICMQKSTDATIKNSFNRVVGTAIGGVFGVALLFVETHLHMQRFMPLYLLVVALLLIPIMLLTLAIKKPTMTAFTCIVFLSIVINHFTDASPYPYALDRLLDTTIGIIVTLIVNLALPPYEKKGGAAALTRGDTNSGKGSGKQ